MKKLFDIYLLLFCLVLCGSCNNDDEPQAALEILESKINFQALGGEGYVHFTAPTQVKVEVNVDWCTITEVSAGKVTFDVTPNHDYIGRNAVLTLSCGSNTEMFHINQAGAVFAYNQDEWLLRTGNEATSIPVTLYGSFDCEVVIPAEAQSWLSFRQTPGEHTGYFVVTKNTTGEMRGTTVQVVSADRETGFQVIQYDMDDLLGLWNGQFTSSDGTYGLQDVQISRESDGTYMVSNLLTGMPITLKATEQDHCLAFQAGQYLGDVNGLYHMSFELVDTNLMYVKDPSRSISLGPVILNDNTFALAFGRVKESDPLAFVFRIYEDKTLNKWVQDLAIFINCLLYK